MKAIALVMISAVMCMAQTVRVSGIVMEETAHSALKGVAVCLLKKAIYDTSDVSGAFALSDVSIIRPLPRAIEDASFVGKNGLLSLSLSGNDEVAIQTYSINGKLLSSMEGRWQAGFYTIPCPVKASGIFLYKIRIGNRLHSLKFIVSGNRTSQAGIRFRPCAAFSPDHAVKSSKQLASSATDTIMASMDGFYPSKTPVASIASNLQILMRKVSLKNGVKPGVITGATSQGTAFAIGVGPSGKTIDSISITVTMNDCPEAKMTYTFLIPGPISIPDNGVVSLGDSVKLVFLDSTVSGSFSTRQTFTQTTSSACYTTQITTFSGGGYIIQTIPYYNHTFHLYGSIQFSNSLFALTVNQAHGKVTRSPEKTFYFPGETVELQASPEDRFTFSGWTGDVSRTSDSYAWVVMNANKCVNAMFASNFFLTIDTANGNVYKYPDKTSYSPGDTVRLIPSASFGFCFSGWQGGVLRTSADTAWVLMDDSKTITAEFKAVYSLGLTGSNGRIARHPETQCFTLNTRDTVMLVAIPDSGYRLYAWQGDLLRTSGDTAWVIMDSSKTISGKFRKSNIRVVFQDTVPVYCAAISPDGSKVLTGTREGKAKLWDANTGALLRVLPENMVIVYSVAFSPDGLRMLTGDWTGNAKLWETATGALIRTFSHGSLVYAAAISSDGKKILTGSLDGKVKLWDAQTDSLIRTMDEGDSTIVTAVAFTPDGSQALSGSWENTATLWETVTGEKSRTFTGHSGIVDGVAVSPDNSKILTASNDLTAKIWDRNTGLVLRTLTGHNSWVVSAAFSPDGTKALTGSYDQTAKLWETETGALIKTFQGHSGRVMSAVFSSDGAKVLTASEDGTAILWDVY